MDTSSISFTALYTGQVWYEHGLSAPFFTSSKSRLMYWGLQPGEKIAALTLGVNSQHLLLQRHHIMNYRIQQLIKDGFTQILELACGLSPRGYTLTRQHPELNYIEADLPAMAKHKKALLKNNNGFGKHHQVTACNILERGAPNGLDYILDHKLDRNQKTIIITEGLITYFSRETLIPFWKTIASAGKNFKELRYFADCYPAPRKSTHYKMLIGPMKLVGALTRSDLSPLFDSAEHATACLKDTGFNNTITHTPEDYYSILNIPKTRNAAITKVIEAIT